MSILIKNGLIVDGTGKEGYKADLYVENDRIKEIGENLDLEADKVIDAEGLVVAPGFIDTHSHSDLDVLENPEVLPKVKQGITTEILGQDGISMAPLPKEHISSWRKNLAGLDGVSDNIDWEYETTDNYLSMIEEVGPGLNQGYLVPHGNIRMEAMGLDNRLPTEEELQKMRDITRREMEAGAWGLSTGLIYIPCAYGEAEEIIEMCKVVAEYDGVFVTHQRSEADDILNSMKEIIHIGRESGVRVHFSHFKVCGKNNWDKIDGVLELLEEAQAEGIDVTFDQYPYVAGSTMLGVVLPGWAHDGGTDKLIERLKDDEARERMKHDIINGIEGWDNFIDFAGFDGIFITSVVSEENQDTVGLSLTELAEKRGTDPFTATFDIILEEENAVGMVDFYGTEEHVVNFMRRPEMNVCTDGLLSPGKPHPRLYGAFPRVLGKYVREEGHFTLEEAVNKMTEKPATRMRLTDRGVLAEGKFADITIFNPETIIDKGTYTDPIQYPEGIEYVIINGGLTIEEGEHTHDRSGKVLRRGRD